ncbi:MAG TPA: universal stress protein [Dermatophilaceae bacterium]|nr:universal stress protein [Dermatophilaceae bacterium]
MSSADPAPRPDDPVPAGAVVAGLDGSDRDTTVLEFAAGAATRARHPLHLLHAHEMGGELLAADAPALGGILTLGPGAGLADDDILESTLAEAHSRWPELPITGSQPWDRPERALVDASRGAYLVVVGAEPRRGLDRLLLGRSSLATAMHADCPVVVIPEGVRTGPEGPVVVGVDGSAHSRAAAERALWIAGVRGTSAVVVVAWYLEMVDGVVVTTPGTPEWDTVTARYRAMAESVLEPLRERYPDVPVEVRVVRGPAAPTLVEQAVDAGLVVVGSRGRGGFAGMLLGSVSQQILETAPCPVMVIRAPR